ncbi:MAG: hypothetical protein ACK5Y2_06720 [Bdellovibrionales bacterium]
MKDQIIPHLQAGGAVFIFPAGEVSMKSTLEGLPFEKSWKTGTSALLSAVPNAEVLPVFVADEASTTWYRVRRQAEKQKLGKGMLEKTMGKMAWAVIPLFHLREIATNIGREITFGVGHRLAGNKLLKRFEKPEGTLDAKGLMNYLRALTFSMIDRLSPVVDAREMKPIWNPENETTHKALIFDELKAIDPQPLRVRGGVDIHLVKPANQNINTPLAKAKVPFEAQLNEYERALVDNINDIDQLNQTVQALDGQDIPPLLGIYSNLRGRYLDFAFDPDFNTVDGMIVVDMHEMNKNPALQAEYAKYMTEKGVEQYRKANGLE